MITENKTSTEKHLHLVAFDVPYPANYGGIVDVLYKLKSLHAAGIKITFHCFFYKRHNPPNDELKKYCDQIFYYKRKQNLFRLFFAYKPYIVSSRSSSDLLENLLSDNSPILFDGIHSCYYLDHPALKDRKKYVRAHNIEHSYYHGLAAVERNFFKRGYFHKDGQRLHAYEPVLSHATTIFPIAKMDVPHFSKYSKTVYVPPFFITDHAKHEVNKSDIHGRFILFHGNLRIRENELAAKFIINEVGPLVRHKIVIAGKSPSTWLKNEASVEDNVQLIADPSTIQLDSLIQYAQVNLLLTFQQTGVKLKLIHALEHGKFVVINSKMNDSDVFEGLCSVRDTAEEIAKKLDDLMRTDFTVEFKAQRDEKFRAIFDNQKNAQKIIDVIFG